jgi:hypothetical protein
LLRLVTSTQKRRNTNTQALSLADSATGSKRLVPPARATPYLKGVLGEVAAAAAKTDTFLGERYRWLVRRIGRWRPADGGKAGGRGLPGWHLMRQA